MKTGLILGTILAIGFTSLFGQINEKRSLSETNHQIYFASYSPDGKLIATTGSDNNIILWNTETGIIYRTLVGLKKRPNRIVFSADSKRLFSAGEDGLITSWDPALVKIFNSTDGHIGSIKALDISADGIYLASGGEDKILRVWAIAGNNLKLVYELKGHKKSITALKFSPNGTNLVSGSADKSLKIWDMRNGNNIADLAAHDGWIRCVDYSPDGRFIASGGDDNLIKIWNAQDLSAHKTLEGHTDWVQTLSYTRTGNHIISGGHDHRIRIWDVQSGEEVGSSEKLEQIVLSVDASPSRSDFVSSCLMSEELRVWAHGFGEDRPEYSPGSMKAETVQPGFLPDRPGEEKPESKSASPYPLISLYSPEPVNGEVIHDRDSILIIGKVEDPEGIQTMLVNRQRVQLSASGVFQIDFDLNRGENKMDLVVVSNKGKMTRSSFVIHCTDPNASRTAEAQPGVYRGKYHALIIGVDEYVDEKIPNLDYPIADAGILYQILVTHYTFSEKDIVFLKNPNRTDMIIAMDSMSRIVTEQDNLLIFYAGHGFWDEKSGIGYWLPHDAEQSNTANWFRNSTLRDFIGSIQSKHTLLIADACFSGSIFKTRSAFGVDAKGIQKLHDLPSRKAMTSGALKEEVPDKSVFVKYLISELIENKEKFLSSEELFGNFKTAVLNNSPNVPMYGTIQNVGDQGGDFIFVRK